MDHAYITGVGLVLIGVDSFSGWPEVICALDKKSSTIKQIPRVIFSRNDIPKTLVSDNAPEFCDGDLNLWLEKIGCKLYKTLPYTPQSNGVGGKNGANRKNGTGSMFLAKRKIEVFLPRLILSYRTIPHGGRLESTSDLMGRQIRALLAISYSTNKKNVVQKEQRIKSRQDRIFIMQKGHNTVIIKRKKGNSILAHPDPIRPQGNIKRKMRKKSS